MNVEEHTSLTKLSQKLERTLSFAQTEQLSCYRRHLPTSDIDVVVIECREVIVKIDTLLRNSAAQADKEKQFGLTPER